MHRFYTWLLFQKLKALYSDRIFLPTSIHIGKGFRLFFDLSQSVVTIGNGFQARDCFQIRSGRGSKLSIGQNVFFNNDCRIHCFSEITIGSDCQFGEGVKFYDHNHHYKTLDKLISDQGYSSGTIKIGNNCWIGANVVILKDVEIGDNVVVGAGCVVHKSIPSNTVVINNQELIYKPY